MDIILLTFGLVCLLIGVLGSILPVLPGPIISRFGLLLLYCTKSVPTNHWIIWVSLTVVIIISILDYLIPAQGTKKFGGSKYGIWGTNIGLVVGIIFPIPLGFITGPFVGAFLGEILYNSKDKNRAFKAATGSMIGLLVSSFMKFILCMSYLGIFIWELLKNINTIF